MERRHTAILLAAVLALAAAVGCGKHVSVKNGHPAELWRFGYMDKMGRVVIPPRFAEANSFKEGLASVGAAKGGWQYIDRTGRVVIGNDHADRHPFSEGLAQVTNVNDRRFSYVDKKGCPVFHSQYKDTGAFSGGLTPFWSGGYSAAGDHVGYGYIDKTGKVVVRPRFSYADDFSEGLAAVGVVYSGRGKYGYIDKHGNWTVRPRFDNGNRFSEGLAAAWVGKAVGFVDKKGMWVIRPRYQDAGDFSEGLAAVQVADNWGYIDKTGKMTISPQPFITGEPFSDGRARIEMPSIRSGFIDKTGRVVIKPRFEAAMSFREGLALVAVDEKHWGYIDTTGKMVIAKPPSPFSAMDYRDSGQEDRWSFSEGLAPVEVRVAH